MDTLEILQLIIPLLILQLGLIIYTLIDISRNGVRNLNKVVWILIVLFVNILGPIIYLIFGRGDDVNVED
ncbi:MAG: PLD nuclease N-terminal domain-containing protein [Eubacteriaceae bacterium]